MQWYGIRDVYIAEAEKQVKDENAYKDFQFNKKILEDFVKTRNKMFGSFKSKKIINKKQLILHMNTKRALI